VNVFIFFSFFSLDLYSRQLSQPKPGCAHLLAGQTD